MLQEDLFIYKDKFKKYSEIKTISFKSIDNGIHHL